MLQAAHSYQTKSEFVSCLLICLYTILYLKDGVQVSRCSDQWSQQDTCFLGIEDLEASSEFFHLEMCFLKAKQQRVTSRSGAILLLDSVET